MTGRKRKRLLKLIAIVLFLALTQGTRADEYQRFAGIIGVNSIISAGDHSIEEIVKMAREQNLKVVILTDHALARGEYGIWPLRRIVRKTVERKSILSYGAGRYINLVREIDRANPDIVVIPACDVAPFHYWTGSPFTGDLGVRDWSRQLIVVGLKEAEDYGNLPLVANRYRPLTYNWKSLVHLWPLLILILGILMFRKRQFSYRDSFGKELGPRSRRCQILGGFIIFVSLLFWGNSFPFSAPREFDQYHGDKGVAPYQKLIDYANREEAMTFWSTPEAKVAHQIGKIDFMTLPHNEDLMNTYEYTGFGAVYGAPRTAYKRGEEWDQSLLEYCRGQRKKPVWGIGEVDFHGPSEKIDYIQTVFLLRELSEAEVLEAMRRGRMYALYQGSGQFSLEEFTVEDSLSNRIAHMGEELAVDSSLKVRIGGVCSGSKPSNVKIQVIRDGKLFQVFGTEELQFSYEIDGEPPETFQKSYYRLIVDSSYGQIVSNPIFVTKYESINEK